MSKLLPRRREWHDGGFQDAGIDWNSTIDNLIPWVIGAVIIAGLALLLWASVLDARQWAAYKVAHKCHVTAKVSSSTFNTFDAKGNIGVGTVPAKTGWTCDDGITYFREG